MLRPLRHHRRRPHPAVLVLAAILALPGCSDGEAQGPAQEGRQTPGARSAGGDGVFGDIPAIVRDVEPSVVAVLAAAGGGEGQGSGVIVRRDGLIVTNAGRGRPGGAGRVRQR